jgi:YspA, cpYpsA-related SLOG family
MAIILAIVGGRDYNDYINFKILVDAHIKEIGLPEQIVSGGAKGVDSMAKRYADENNIPIIEYIPDWNKHGKKAGILRNTDIIEASTHVLAFPCQNSKGTHDSINKATKLNKDLKVINV